MAMRVAGALVVRWVESGRATGGGRSDIVVVPECWCCHELCRYLVNVLCGRYWWSPRLRRAIRLVGVGKGVRKVCLVMSCAVTICCATESECDL